MANKGDQAVLLNNQKAVDVCAHVKIFNVELQEKIEEFTKINRQLMDKKDTDFNDQGQGANICTMSDSCVAALKIIGFNVQVMSDFTDKFATQIVETNKDSSFDTSALQSTKLKDKASLKK